MVVLILHDSPFYSLLSTFSPIFLFILLVFTFFFHDVGTSTLRTLANEDLGTLAEYHPLTGYEPNDLHISETTEQFIQESSGENRSLNSHDLECDDYTIGKALSSPLFTQDREDAASRRQAYHSPDEGLSSSQSSSVGHFRSGRLVADQFDSLVSNVRENPRRAQKMSKSGFFWNDRESRFSLIVKQRIKEVELVDSLDDLKSSCSVRGIQMPNFEVLDATIASALKRIIHDTQFKRKVSLEEQKAPKRGPFPSRKTDCLPDLRVLPGHWSQ